MSLIDELVAFQKKLDEKTTAQHTEELYESIRKVILEEVKLLDKEKVKTFIIDHLCLGKSVEFDLGVTTDRTGDDDEYCYADEHKQNTVMDKIEKEFDKALIPTGSILFRMAHNYCEQTGNTFNELNSDVFIKEIQTILGIECMPITFNVREHCDMNYVCSYYPYLCFYTNKITDNINTDVVDPFLQKLQEFREKVKAEKLAQEQKSVLTKPATLLDEQKLKEEYLSYLLSEGREIVYKNIRRMIIDSKCLGLDTYEHISSVYIPQKFDKIDKDYLTYEFTKIIGIENINVTYNWKFQIVFTPADLKKFTITDAELEDKRARIEAEKTEIREDILEWFKISKSDVTKTCLHFLKVRKFYQETENKNREYCATTITRDKYHKFFKQIQTESIDVSKYKDIVNQELKDKINEILGVTGFDFKTKHDFCDCGLPWGLEREDNSIYNKYKIEHGVDCKYKSEFICIDREDDSRIFIFLPKTI